LLVADQHQQYKKIFIFCLGVLTGLPVLTEIFKTFMNPEYIWNLIAKKLSGEASSEELNELASLLRNNPDLHYSIQTITDLWKHDQHNIAQVSDNAFNRHIDRMTRMNIDYDTAKVDVSNNYTGLDFFITENKRKGKTFFLWTSVILILLTATTFIFKYNNHSTAANQNQLTQKTSSEISTRNGSKTNVVLPDGTLVKLNAGSKLTYDKDYGNTIREVNLTGEAFFDVVKNKEKPFIIHTRKIDIKVLGTVFNVKSYPNEATTETSLVKGSIEVTFKDRPAEKVILKPNEKLVVANDDPSSSAFAKMQAIKQTSDPIVAISHLNYTKKDSTIIETAWVQNKLVFRDELFRELALQMERWYAITIHFNDSDLAELRFTGSFENENIQQALDALKLSWRFNYSIKDNEVTISK
jgi:transmembrane sensor